MKDTETMFANMQCKHVIHYELCAIVNLLKNLSKFDTEGYYIEEVNLLVSKMLFPPDHPS